MSSSSQVLYIQPNGYEVKITIGSISMSHPVEKFPFYKLINSLNSLYEQTVEFLLQRLTAVPLYNILT